MLKKHKQCQHPFCIEKKNVLSHRIVSGRGDHFRFGSVFIKKIIKSIFFWKKTETGSNRPVSVRFLGKKPIQTSLARFFRFWPGFSVWLGFPGLAWFFSRFRFGFFGFLLIKPKLNRTGRFFQNFNRFNRFFFRFGFFGFFFLVFSV